MSTQTLIEARALHRYFGKYHAVDNFNLTLHKGEVLGLLGPNGAGKSTTMQMLTGNLSPTSGEIIINGINLLDEPLKARRSIGYLPEQPPVYRDMTPAEYLRYCALLHDIPGERQGKALANAVDRCGLGDVQNKLIGNLSKGYQQRLGIAQAILHQPQVVILDEPTVGLDPIQIRQIRDLIHELGKDHSVILSTHILPEVQAVCDRVKIINHGKTVFSDSFAELAQKRRNTSLSVVFEKGGGAEKIAALAGVEQIKTLQPGTFQLEYSPPLKPSDIFQLAVKEGWVISELRTDSQTLEQIFMNLIHFDEPKQQKIVKKGGDGYV